MEAYAVTAIAGIAWMAGVECARERVEGLLARVILRRCRCISGVTLQRVKMDRKAAARHES